MSSSIVACPVCGQRTKAIPAGGVCPECGANPQMSAMLNTDMFGSSQSSSSTAQKREPEPTLTISMIVWGLSGGLIFALCIGLLCHILFDEFDNGMGWGGANMGFLLGIILGSTWGAARKEYVGTLGDVLIGILVGSVWSFIQYFYESRFIAPPDDPMYLHVIMGAICGAVAGFMCIGIKYYIDNHR
jgi:hypothetical protein